jgi:redox-sensing transcriptional repressor
MVYESKVIASAVKRLYIDIAIIAVPQNSAQEIADKLTEAGVRAILNFAPVKLNVPAKVKLRNVDLSTELINLTHFLSC